MDERIGKDHTQAYSYLDGVAGRLHAQWSRVSQLNRRSAHEVRAAVRRQCCREWDEAIVKATNHYPLDDICAAVSRLKDGKQWLSFLPPSEKVAA